MPFPHKKPRTYHEKYADTPELMGWHANLARRPKGETTADYYLRHICRVVEPALRASPVALLKMPQTELEDAVTRCITYELTKTNRKGKTNLGSSVNNLRKALNSFLAFHLREVKRDNYIPGAESYPNAEDATIPEQPQLRLVLQAADARTAVCLVVMAQGGQREQVLGRKGRNGLRLRDLVDLRLDADGTPGFAKVPCQVMVCKELSKNGKEFFFFLGPESCNTILAYLRLRRERGEHLTPDSPLVRPERGEARFMHAGNVGNGIRRAMQRAGVEGYPYLWRSYYCNRADLAQGKGLKEKWREFFMGHKGDIQTRYGLRKKGLPGDFIEAMRSSYAKALPYLESKATTEPDAAAEARRALLATAGASDEELNALEEQGLSDGEWAEHARSLFTQRLQAHVQPVPTPVLAAPVGEPVQRVVA
ncbi:MAG TPA: hypothetical protein VM241_08225, partial [Candidatus Thermoplasmatota archaeon]|nr:hypothetical protein [Candidatus Thermoplasmatota archaeon]